MGMNILVFNALAYTLTAICYYLKIKKINAGLYLMVYYTICAWGAVAYYTHPLFTYMKGNSNYEFEPFLYLFLTIGIFAYPILKYDSSGIRKVQVVDSKFLIKFIKIVLIVQIVLYVTLFPSFIKAVLSSNIGDYRNDTYDEAEVVKFPFYALNLLSRLYMGMRNVVIIIACYALLFEKTRTKLVKLFFVSSFLFPIYAFTAYMSRAVMVMQLAFSIFLFIMLLSFIAYRMRKKIILYLISIAIPIFSVFVIISNSRFGNMASYMLYRYLGESFNNYNTEFYYQLKGNTWGTAYFNFFRKLMGEDIPFKTTREKWAYLDNITGVDTHVFYTFIGGLNIEFGFFVTVIIGIVLSWLVLKALRPFSILTLPKLILLGMLAYTLLNGSFFFVLQGDWGNLELLFTIFCYILFKKFSTKKYILPK